MFRALNPFCGAPGAYPVATFFTPEWGDIRAKRWRMEAPRPKGGLPGKQVVVHIVPVGLALKAIP